MLFVVVHGHGVDRGHRLGNPGLMLVVRNRRLGKIDVPGQNGKAFDALVLAARPPNVQAFARGTAERAADVLQKVLALGDDRNVAEVYVGGRCVKGARH